MVKNMTQMTDEQLLTALADAAGRVSYFNAAEGTQYTQEGGARRAAKDAWHALVDEATERGIFDPENYKGYLV